MSTKAKLAMMLSIKKDYRDQLRKMAAEQNLKDPTQVVTASGIARDIVCDYLDRIHDGSDQQNFNEPS